MGSAGTEAVLHLRNLPNNGASSEKGEQGFCSLNENCVRSRSEERTRTRVYFRPISEPAPILWAGYGVADWPQAGSTHVATALHSLQSGGHHLCKAETSFLSIVKLATTGRTIGRL